MPQVELTSQLSQLAECPSVQIVPGETVAETLEAMFANHDPMRQHILDDVGAIHSHLALFVNGEMIGRDQLQTPLDPNAKVFIMQALSGG